MFYKFSCIAVQQLETFAMKATAYRPTPKFRFGAWLGFLTDHSSFSSPRVVA